MCCAGQRSRPEHGYQKGTDVACATHQDESACSTHPTTEPQAGLRSLAALVVRLPALILVAAARVYQRALSPLLGRTCRFYPSCSEYFIGSVRRHGALSGALRGIARICRCHPFHPGGYDPP